MYLHRDARRMVHPFPSSARSMASDRLDPYYIRHRPSSTSSILSKMALFVSIVGLLLSIVSVATPAWQEVTNITKTGTTSTLEGLFRSCVTTCVSGVCTNKCAQYTRIVIDSTIHAVRAMCIIGLLLGIGCTLNVVFYVFVRSDIKLLRIAGAILAFSAGFFILVGIMIFATERSSLGKYDYSFALEIVAAILFLTTGGLLLVG